MLVNNCRHWNHKPWTNWSHSSDVHSTPDVWAFEQPVGSAPGLRHCCIQCDELGVSQERLDRNVGWSGNTLHSSLVTLLEVPGWMSPTTTTENQIHFNLSNMPRHIPKVLGVYHSACTSVSNLGEATNITAKYLKYFTWHTQVKTW